GADDLGVSAGAVMVVDVDGHPLCDRSHARADAAVDQRPAVFVFAGPVDLDVAEVRFGVAADVDVADLHQRGRAVAVARGEGEAVDGDLARLGTGVVHAAVERLGRHRGDVQVDVLVVPERRPVDAVGGVVD